MLIRETPNVNASWTKIHALVGCSADEAAHSGQLEHTRDRTVPLEHRERDAVELGARLEPHRQAQARDVDEAQLAQVEHDRTVSVLQDGVHLALEGRDGRAVELPVHLDERGLADDLLCGTEAFYLGQGSAVRRVSVG